MQGSARTVWAAPLPLLQGVHAPHAGGVDFGSNNICAVPHADECPGVPLEQPGWGLTEEASLVSWKGPPHQSQSAHYNLAESCRVTGTQCCFAIMKTG